MHARFLLGPAGSGKTHRCLAEIREQLLASPEGAPLVLLAPKQATFQLERQLLEGEGLPGYTRLHILSFERLAEFVLQQAGIPPRPLLSEEGRTMVLRALLARNKDKLQIFRSSAGLTGFARQLSLDLRELQRHQISPGALQKLACNPDLPQPLQRKLHDLHLLLQSYLEWLRDHNLEDADRLLDIATEALGQSERKTKANNPASGCVPLGQLDLFGAPLKEVVSTFSDLSGPIHISALWLDGFAEMTPQEIAFLAAVAPCCDTITLAFCLAPNMESESRSWLSIWSGINQTRLKCQARLAVLPGKIKVHILPGEHPTRFSENPALEHLEQNWTRPQPFAGVIDNSVRIAACASPQAEAVLAAHEILRFVRAGGRFREAAVLLRSMEGYHDELRRVFSSRQIPFFLDRRESVAHHPLAELTRCALSMVAFDWVHDDWFGALKTGLVCDDESAVDQLENDALAHGWKGHAWFSPLQTEGKPAQKANEFCDRWLPPFAKLRQDLTTGSELCATGTQLARSVRDLWGRLGVEKTLESWSKAGVAGPSFVAPHATVWDQMNAWLDDIALAFPKETLSLRDWLPVLESGLCGLTVGVIPPALDQVLIGAIDRSRNPDLKLAIIVGANESVFPCTPKAGTLLTETDRDALERCNVVLGPNIRQLLSRERFLGYIACTRSRQRLVLTYAQHDAEDTHLNPSPFVSQLKSLFPTLADEEFSAAAEWQAAEHVSELIAPTLYAECGKNPPLAACLGLPLFVSLRSQLQHLPVQLSSLSPAAAEKLYGKSLKTSVSRLEQFAACPFKFFIDSGLRAQERHRFELDPREKGDFQHLVLAQFHEELRAQNRRWHDLAPSEARELINVIATRLTPQFHDGLLTVDSQSRFMAQAMTKSLQNFIETCIRWMAQYDFEPEAVERKFGHGENALPAWELDLGDGHRLVFRGTIDRIDLCRADKDTALAVVIDYKSSARKLEKMMMDHGLQLQLPAYLSVLRHIPEPERFFGAKHLIPAGVFYVNLRGEFAGGKTRSEVLSQLDEQSQQAYQHTGRFDFAALSHLDNRKSAEGTQFKFRIKKNGEPAAIPQDPMSTENFERLLDQVEETLLNMGRQIFSGISQPDPYQKGTQRACDKCDFQGICRIDPWIHNFRVLRPLGEESEN